MYDGVELHGANDALWAEIAARLPAVGIEEPPPVLDRSRTLAAIWSDPGLLLAQCCGYPMVTRYRDRLRYVATPCYAAPGCHAGDYRSRIVVRADDRADTLAMLRGRRAAINDRQSNSGANLFRAAVAPLAGGSSFFADIIETGSHAASLRAVADDRADVAAIDTVSFAHLARAEPTLAARVRTIRWTEASPGLPYVTSIAMPDDVVRSLRAVLDAVTRAPETRPARDALLLTGMERLPDNAYYRLLDLERDAARMGYPELA
jgi:ABC-type phosphate/phosphonate transport system substrate-binding protein